MFIVSKEIEKEQELLNNSNVDAIYKKIQVLWSGYHYNESNSLYNENDEDAEEENMKAYLYKALTETGKTEEEKNFLYNIAHIPVDENYIIQQVTGKDDSYRIYPYLTKEQREHIKKNGKNSCDYISLNAQLECKDKLEGAYSKNTTVEMIEAIDRFICTDLKGIDWNKELLYSLVITKVMNPIEVPKNTKVKNIDEFNLYDTEESPLYDIEKFYSLVDKYHNGEIKNVKLQLEKEKFERLLVELSTFGTETDLRFIKGTINDNNCHRLALEFFGYYNCYMEEINRFKMINAIPEQFKSNVEEAVNIFNKAKSIYDFIMKHPYMTSFMFALRDLNKKDNKK